MLNEFLELFFGNNNSVAWWAAAMVWALIGTAISMWVKVSKRKRTDPETPYKFSIWFFIQDNLMRIFMNLLIIFTLLRFGQTLIGEDATLEAAVILGLLSDQLVKLITNIQRRARDNYLKF